jgi:hypothetical protein
MVAAKTKTEPMTLGNMRELSVRGLDDDSTVRKIQEASGAADTGGL